MAYYVIYPLLFLLSMLPLRVLYVLSAIILFILKDVTGYRKEIIRSNFQRSFPNRPAHWIEEQVQLFYRHLADLMVESVKLISCSPSFLKRHVEIENPELLRDFFEDKKNIIISLGHTGNWEWAGAAVAVSGPFNLHVIYKPVKSEAFDKLFRKFRERFGATAIPMQQAYKTVVQSPFPTATAFLADQSSPPESSYWLNFLNQDTPFFKGIERITLKTGQPLIYGQVRKIRRGYYSILFSEIQYNDEEASITQNFAKLLEEGIKAQPFNWLWSHKRWKHKRNTN